MYAIIMFFFSHRNEANEEDEGIFTFVEQEKSTSFLAILFQSVEKKS